MPTPGGTPPRVALVPIPPAALRALVARDLTVASRLVGVKFSEFFIADDTTWLWRLRLEQVELDPSSAAWIARAAVALPAEIVVGHAGFHGPPDGAGMVEVGYSVDPAHRGQGYATAMLAELISWASRAEGVRVIRASVRPDNAASLATIAHFGFVAIGEQWDEEDGLELVFERPPEEPGRARPMG